MEIHPTITISLTSVAQRSNKTKTTKLRHHIFDKTNRMKDLCAIYRFNLKIDNQQNSHVRTYKQ